MIQLEQLFDNSPSDRNFQKLADFAVESGLKGVGIRFGAATLTWPGASLFSNASFTVAHGLGGTPSFVVGSAIAPAGGFVFEVHPELVDATNVQWRARTLDGTTPGAATTKDFYWLVIG